MILSGTVLVLLWGVAAGRLPTLWRDRRQRALWGSVVALALTRTVAFPPVADRLGTPPTLPHLLGVVAGYFLLRFISLVTGTGGRRWQLGLTVAVLLALAGLAACAGGIPTSADGLAGRLPPATVGYWVVLEAYLGAALVIATALFWTTGRDAPAGLPRLGLWAMAAGTSLIAGYAAVKAVLVVAHALGVAVDFPAIEPVARSVQGCGVLLMVAGALVPATRRARSVAAAYRSLLLLRPLWTTMRDAFPEVILFSPRRAIIELAGVDDVRLRLYRRVIEIRDGMLALRPYLPASAVLLPAPGPSDGAENPSPSGAVSLPAPGPSDGAENPGSDPAEAEARAILLALRRRAAAEPPAATPGSWAPVGPEMADEVAWLSRVSVAYRRLRAAVVNPDGAPIPRPSGSAR